MTHAFRLFFLLCVGHAVCDYPLQGDFLARGKNHTNPIPGVPWYQCLLAHALIHAGAVYLITGSLTCGLAELLLHCYIDHSKCSGLLTFDVDQLMHVWCKAGWAVMVWAQ